MLVRTIAFGLSLILGSLVAGAARADWYSIKQFAPQANPTVGGMAANPGGGMYAATDAQEQFEFRTVQSFGPNGQYLGKVGSAEAPNDVAVSATGNVLLADGFARQVLEYTAAGVSVRSYPNDNLTFPLSVAACPGSVWTVGGDNVVKRFNSATGALVSQFTIPTITKTGGEHWNAVASDIAVSADGVIYVSLTDNIIGPNQGNRILGLGFTGALLGQFGSAGSDNGQFDFSYGSSLALDGTGRLFVSDSGNHRIQIFDAFTGVYLDKFGTPGSAAGQLNSPGALGVDVDGNVWVADRVSDQTRIQIFSTVPEPGALVLASLGGVAVLIATRRRRGGMSG